MQPEPDKMSVTDQSFTLSLMNSLGFSSYEDVFLMMKSYARLADGNTVNDLVMDGMTEDEATRVVATTQAMQDYLFGVEHRYYETQNCLKTSRDVC